jgi:hypothetical protein
VRVISVHVEEQNYRDLQALAGAQGRPVAALLREAMDAYARRQSAGPSMADLAPRSSGRERRRGRGSLLDEMRGR